MPSNTLIQQIDDLINSIPDDEFIEGLEEIIYVAQTALDARRAELEESNE